MAEKFHISITYGSRRLIDCNSNCAAFISEKNAATCCVTNDIAVRIVFASRVKVYLDSLIDTIVADSHLSKDILKNIIDEIVNDIDYEEKREDPTQSNNKSLNEILAQLKESLREEGGGNG